MSVIDKKIKKKQKTTGEQKMKESSSQVDTTSTKVVTHDLSELDFKSKKLDRSQLFKLGNEKKKNKKNVRQSDPFPGDAPIKKEKIKKYERGHKIKVDGLKTKYAKQKFKSMDSKFSKAAKQAARTELLQTEQAGSLEVEDGDSAQITQHDIANCVDITSAQKYFELDLDKFGPYRINYTRNGRFLLMGGKRGHVAAIDWQTKKLLCETNVMESVNDVKWLHVETMFAVAQKQWTYIYDNQGIELHCLKQLDSVQKMEFLPYHFLLASANARGYLSYLDVSVGQKVAGFTTGLGRLDVMCQNKTNAVVHLGHSGGTVTMWSPNVKEPLVKMLCHGAGTRSIAVDNTGRYMATSGIDRTLKIWDLRQYKMVSSYKISAGASNLAFSQRGLLAAGLGDIVEVYQEPCTQVVTKPFLNHRCSSAVNGVEFCAYEDVLGVGHGKGFASLLVPGAGEPNFDALEANPFQTKKQRKQAEVKMLLEKIQPDMISLDPHMLGKLDEKSLEEKFEQRKKLAYLKPQKVDFEPKYKKKGRSKTGNLEKRKKGVQFELKRQQFKEHIAEKQQKARDKKMDEKRKAGPKNVLDRFSKNS